MSETNKQKSNFPMLPPPLRRYRSPSDHREKGDEPKRPVGMMNSPNVTGQDQSGPMGPQRLQPLDLDLDKVKPRGAGACSKVRGLLPPLFPHGALMPDQPLPPRGCTLLKPIKPRGVTDLREAHLPRPPKTPWRKHGHKKKRTREEKQTARDTVISDKEHPSTSSRLVGDHQPHPPKSKCSLKTMPVSPEELTLQDGQSLLNQAASRATPDQNRFSRDDFWHSKYNQRQADPDMEDILMLTGELALQDGQSLEDETSDYLITASVNRHSALHSVTSKSEGNRAKPDYNLLPMPTEDLALQDGLSLVDQLPGRMNPHLYRHSALHSVTSKSEGNRAKPDYNLLPMPTEDLALQDGLSLVDQLPGRMNPHLYRSSPDYRSKYNQRQADSDPDTLLPSEGLALQDGQYLVDQTSGQTIAAHATLTADHLGLTGNERTQAKPDNKEISVPPDELTLLDGQSHVNQTADMMTPEENVSVMLAMARSSLYEMVYMFNDEDVDSSDT